MAKQSTIFFCNHCGTEHPKWMGKCSACGQWNTLTEQPKTKNQAILSHPTMNPNADFQKAQRFQEIETNTQTRITLNDPHFNRVLGGGLVGGSLILMAGEPGIGKSTLMMQLALNSQPHKVLYNSAEESKQQVKLNASRLSHNNLDNLYLASENCLESLIPQIEEITPTILVIDSIQTVYTNQIDSSPGTVSQVRESTAMLMRLAKEKNIITFVIGHITKEGQIAGPKLLEHMVDVVVQFEGERKSHYRLIRCLKNRFGSTLELGVYEMTQAGLKHVDNPSLILMSKEIEEMPGHAISIIQDGTQSMLIECQALVSGAVYGNPQRNPTGIEAKRLNMLLAVIEKQMQLNLRDKDVFFNLVGGLKIQDTGMDLGAVVAIISSFRNKVVPTKMAFCGEVGLSGEVRPVSFLEKRINEVESLGFETLFLPKQGFSQLPKSFRAKKTIQLIPLSRMTELNNYF